MAESEHSPAPYQVPPRLTRWPRRVRYRAWDEPVNLWLARLFILPFTLVGLALIGMVAVAVAYGVAGREQTGRVTRLWTEPTKRSISHHAGYEYDDAGVTRSGTAVIPEQRYQQLERALRSAASLPERPAGPAGPAPGASDGAATIPLATVHFGPIVDSRLRSDDGRTGVCCMVPFALAWNTFVLMAWAGAYWVPWQQRRIVRLGRPVCGRVTGKRRGKGRTTTHYVDYEFATESGETLRGSQTVTEDQWQRAAEGQALTVVHLPGSRWRHLAYEYCPLEAVPQG